MARGPSVVIVARHGARLDASDKTWHLTSPTPYDPPLTYGGWTQGKALGLRIAALLHAREVEQAEATKNGNADLAHLDFSSLDCTTDGPNNPAGGLKPPKRKQKIIIHSSPYLRCIQTSTAIAAGLSQFHPPQTPNLKVPEPGRDKNGVLGHSPLSRSSLSKSPSPAVQPALLGPPADPNLEVYPKAQKGGPEKILLRIDAFLGEWLSPDYFEDITPPPNSTMMVAGAKADLLRRGDFIERQPNENTSKGHFPGGWASKTLAASNGRTQSSDGSLQTIGSLAQALPLRERSSSQGSVFRHRSRSRDKLVSAVHKLPGYIYEPPVPSYAVSGADPIPRGYVSHARDACIQVDFQWDSMRPPQEWGDGGEYGDEWSTMHKRFRKGLAGMMHWYQENGSLPPKDHFPGFTYKEHAQPVQHHASDPLPKPESEHDVDEDEELVLILVTHGAGCNALLGAISNQPVLIDVGLAALSMVVRRDTPRTHSVPSITQRRASVADPGMADTYDMKLLASTDHLRPGVDPAKPQLQPQSPAVVSSPSLESRRRFTNQGTNSPIDSPFSLGEPYRSWNSSLGSMRRSSSSGSNSKYMTSVPAGSASPMTGLWSSLRAPTPDTGSEGRVSPGHDMVLNFANQKPTLKPTTTTADASKETSTSDGRPTTVNNGTTCPEEKEKHDKVAPLPSSIGRTNSQNARGLWAPKPQATSHGLWGPPKLDEVYEHGRGPKRRWTVTERE